MVSSSGLVTFLLAIIRRLDCFESLFVGNISATFGQLCLIHLISLVQFLFQSFCFPHTLKVDVINCHDWNDDTNFPP